MSVGPFFIILMTGLPPCGDLNDLPPAYSAIDPIAPQIQQQHQQGYQPQSQQFYTAQPQQGYAPQPQQGYAPQSQQICAPQSQQGYAPQPHQGYPPQPHQCYPPQPQQGYPPQPQPQQHLHGNLQFPSQQSLNYIHTQQPTSNGK